MRFPWLILGLAAVMYGCHGPVPPAPGSSVEDLMAAARRLDVPGVARSIASHHQYADAKSWEQELGRAVWEAGTGASSPSAAEMDAVWEKILRSCRNPDSPVCRAVLVTAAMRGHPRMVRRLLRGGTRPNFLDRHGFPPLYWAATQLDFPTSEALLQYGANPDLRYTYPRLLRQGPVTTLVVLEERLGPEEDDGPQSASRQAERTRWRQMIRLLKRHGAHGSGDGPATLLQPSSLDTF